MDSTRFDALARLLGASGSRRTALGALLGAGLLGSTEALARKGKRRRPGKQGRHRVHAQQVPANCFPTANCTPGPGKNLSKCDYGDSATLAGKNLKGANLGNANLLGADASGADLRGANLGGACLTNADLSGATINSSTNASTARYCGTIMPDGSINDRDCGRPTRCCEACTPLADECNDETAPCCDGGVCQNGACAPAGACDKDPDCAPDEVCCTGMCVAGICCTNAACGPTGNNCVSAGGAPTTCLCGLNPPCSPDETCCPADAGPLGTLGACTSLSSDEGNCGACGAACGPCERCVDGRCVAVPNRTVACDGTALVVRGNLACSATAFLGVCVDGACACGSAVYAPETNSCACIPQDRQTCAANPPPNQCCRVHEVCVGGDGTAVAATGCFGCPG